MIACLISASKTLELASSLSHRVEEGPAGEVYLDDAAPLPQEGCRIGVARSRLVARVAAESADVGGRVVVPAGREAEFLAPKPVSALRPTPETAAALERWGVRTAGQLAALPGGEVAARLGKEGWLLHQAARGEDERALVPRRPERAFSEGAGFDWPVADLASFSQLALPVLARLAERAGACRRLEVTLSLEPNGTERRVIELAAPTSDARTWLAHLCLELERRPPRRALAGLDVGGKPEERRAAQLSLFGPPGLSPDELSTALARLAALVGPDRFGTPRLVDSLRPEAFELAPYAPPPPPEQRPAVELEAAETLLAPRVVRPPRRVAVEGEPPRRVDGRDVARFAGPWRLLEGWWGKNAVERDYWDVELSDLTLLRLYRDRRGWFCDGLYD